ncbi:hypothetical protein AQS8620_01447 [Aquimixticola soesokkakensis]|uniref:Uncharacterized protein n=1 Tax=Aquimixticola soesokkakensis TaxID=1519096 RepID=A0A1Y5SFH7_9RHOB|nr:hypothetical protein [Aquimixticola soesokkakensis]SLN38396.1 hypothetical protein AQS8620_01447 [Aquimixticola soesokkakensis]
MDTRKPGAVPTALLQLLADGVCRTRDEIATQGPTMKGRQLSDGLMRLCDRGYMAKMAGDCFQLTDAGLTAAKAGTIITSGPKGPTKIVHRRKDTFRGRAWTSMRIRHYFTIGEVAGDAQREEDKEPGQNVTRYLLQLRKAGYVAELARRQKGGPRGSIGYKRYVLVKNTGPNAPVYRAAKNVMHDFNTGEDVPCSLD